MKLKKKLKLRGFNNLTKSLSFNIYDICYAKTEEARKEYLAYIDEVYNSERLENILTEVTKIIGATVLNISTQDYEPMGASVTTLISEEPMCNTPSSPDDLKSEAAVMHLDKSHICAHTYPESDSKTGISTFRVDIDISTCGHISPLKALNYLIRSFDSDVVLLDYRVRGFTRDISGKKHYIDHKIFSVQNFINKKILKKYNAVDINIYQENLFHTKMVLKKLKLKNYLFSTALEDLTRSEKQAVKENLQQEMTEIFYSRNIYNQ